ncbi:hypothetical protein JAAARDRAFT_29495 [Jaapia argillacea MUCL 33604]|uniref:Mitochondrial carrier protein n=1 Tax=Jaapia argillacea MUCL 33604 TaxID=933084 RepID=A0A067Q956_9AGAM|nr:hypothetical protein JAAARDRAFT_29495 [Jaapia argillacea MUCL 33604]
MSNDGGDNQQPRLRAAGAIAGIGSGSTKVAVGHGFDTVKTRLQCSPPGTYSGAIDCLLKTLRNESLRGLYKGASPPAAGQALVDSVLLGSLHNYRHILFGLGMTEAAPGAPEERRLTLSAHGISGMFAGLTSAGLSTPLEHIKVRLQLQLQSSASQREFKGPLNCARKIIRAHGFFDLWRGFTASLVFRANYFWMFMPIEGFRRTFAKMRGTPLEVNKTLSDFLSGGLGSLVFWVMAIPADNIKNRMYASPLRLNPRPTFLSVSRSIYSTSGAGGFFTGLAPTLVRSFPVNACAYFVWEGLMKNF